MPKPKTKQELIQVISKADILEIATETINRKETASIKKSKESSFIKQLQSSVSSQRDVILVAIKVR